MRVTFLVSLTILILGATIPAQATSAVTVSPAKGHPNLAVAVTGSGFGANEAVDVYVDLVDTLLLVSSGSGSLGGSVTIPASAAPGVHYITAIGRRTGDAAQTAFTATTPWTQFGFGDAHLATNPWENTLSTSNISAAGTLWTHIGTTGASGATMAVAGGYVYVSLFGGIEALTTGGTFLWRAFPTTEFTASPTVSGTVVYIGSTDSTFFALNAATGAKIWSTALGNVVYSSAALANGIVYVGCFDDKIYALSASTGHILWTYPTGAYVDSTPTVVDGVVYVGSADHNIYALNAATGALMWSYPTGGAVESSAAVANGVVYIGSDDDKVYAIRARGPDQGVALWTFATSGVVVAAPAVANTSVFVGSGDNSLYALDAHAGTQKWKLTTGSLVRGAAVANGVVYFTSEDDTLYAVAASSGAILATAVIGYTYFGAPSVSDGVLYVSDYGGNSYAISLAANANAVRGRLQGPPLPASLHPDLRLPVTR